MTTDSCFDDNANSSAAAAALAAARAWTAALASPPPPPPSASSPSSSLFLRRLGIAKLVHERWRSEGEDAGAWFDGGVDALEGFVSEAVCSTSTSTSDKEELAFVDLISDGARLNHRNGFSALFAAQRLLPGPLQRPALLLGAANEWRCSQLWRDKKNDRFSSSSSPDWEAFASSFPAGQEARITDGRRKGAKPDVRKKVEVSEAVRLLVEFEEKSLGRKEKNDGDETPRETETETEIATGIGIETGTEIETEKIEDHESSDQHR